MSRPPTFSIVMATYGRGVHIRPSIESVLRQSCQDFELLVVSDGPDAETEAVVAGFASPRLRYAALVERFGSQSFPNNCGIAESAGPWIAYIGHDDIWSGCHLAEIARTIERDASADVVASGCIAHPPPGSRMAWVTGLFEANAHVGQFIPPSSLAHRRSAVTRLGGWPSPLSVAAPVDHHLLLRFAETGLRFASTGRVSVHKFTAGHRYLAYLDQNSDEQAAMLRDARLDHPEAWSAEIDLAKANGGYLEIWPNDYSGHEPGELYRRSLRNRGVVTISAPALTERVTIRQDDGPRALDWAGLEHAQMPFRWSGPNPNPRVLVPFAHRGRALMTLDIVEYKGPLDDVTARYAKRAVPVGVAIEDGRQRLVIAFEMDTDRPSFVELHTPTMFRPFDDREDGPRLGIAVGDITIEPVP